VIARLLGLALVLGLLYVLASVGRWLWIVSRVF
jgi:hypothetical protein